MGSVPLAGHSAGRTAGKGVGGVLSGPNSRTQARTVNRTARPRRAGSQKYFLKGPRKAVRFSAKSKTRNARAEPRPIFFHCSGPRGFCGFTPADTGLTELRGRRTQHSPLRRRPGERGSADLPPHRAQRSQSALVYSCPTSLFTWDCVASARRGLPLGRKFYLYIRLYLLFSLYLPLIRDHSTPPSPTQASHRPIADSTPASSPLQTGTPSRKRSAWATACTTIVSYQPTLPDASPFIYSRKAGDCA